MLVSQFEDAIAKIKQYLDFAEDFCSYNNIDNRFNDFFKQGVTDYFERQGFVPWELAPKLYAIHLDLVRDQFSGVASSMSRFAKEQVSLISPNNGTLDVLRNFVEKMEEFYETYYGAAGAIAKTISSRRSPDGTLEPSLRDNTQFIATLGYDNLPDIVDFTVDPQPPTKITLWNGNEEFVNGPTVKAFINRRAGTLAMARSKGQSFSEFVEDQGGVVPLSVLNEVFEPGVLSRILAGGGGAGAAATGAVTAGVSSGITSGCGGSPNRHSPRNSLGRCHYCYCQRRRHRWNCRDYHNCCCWCLGGCNRWCSFGNCGVSCFDNSFGDKKRKKTKSQKNYKIYK